MEMEPSFPIQEVDILSHRMRTIDILEDLDHESSNALNKKKQRNKNLSLRPNVGERNGENCPELVDLLRLIECPVCLEVPGPPIYNCGNGHFVCDSCRPRLFSQNCVYCLAQFTRMRNYPLEALVSSPVIPCDFIKNGCNQVNLTLQEYENHVRSCWAKFWCPGRIIPGNYRHQRRNSTGSSEDLSEDDSNCDPEDLSNCPKCFNGNPSRKLKCKYCEAILRPPTPMRIPMDFHETFSSCN